MRLLFIGPYPPPNAGPEMAMKTLLDSSLAEEFDILFLKTNVRVSNEEKGKFGYSMVMAFFSFFYRLTRIMLLKRPELVYYFVTATQLGWLGRDIWCIFIARGLGAKVVIHMRAGHFKNNYQASSPIIRKIIKLACSLVSLGFVQAEILNKQFEGLLDDKNIAAVYNAIDTDKYLMKEPDDYDPNLILFLGHLSYAKGYCDILKIIPEITEKHQNVRFCFAGTKIKDERNVYHNQMTGQKLTFEDPDECHRKFIRGKYNDNYRYMGVVDECRKIELLAECNFLILPSYSEGFSMAVLEALAMGKPVICSPVGALGEIIQEKVNGLLVSPGDTESLARAVNMLLSDRVLREKMAKTNHVYTRENFSMEMISRKMATHFTSIMKVK